MNNRCSGMEILQETDQKKMLQEKRLKMIGCFVTLFGLFQVHCRALRCKGSEQPVFLWSSWLFPVSTGKKCSVYMCVHHNLLGSIA